MNTSRHGPVKLGMSPFTRRIHLYEYVCGICKHRLGSYRGCNRCGDEENEHVVQDMHN